MKNKSKDPVLDGDGTNEETTAPPSSVLRPPSSVTGRRRSTRFLMVSAALILGAVGGAFVEQYHHHHKADVVAAINGVVIDRSAFYDRLQDAAGTPVIQRMAREDLQLAYARKVGAAPTDAQVDALFTEESKRPNYSDQLIRAGQTPDDYKQLLRIQLGQANALCKGLTVTAADVQDYYKLNINPKLPNARYYTPEFAKIDIIVTKTEDDAKRALAALTSGAPFPNVAHTYSKHPSAANGGIVSLYRGQTNASKVPGLENEIFSLKYGDQTLKPMQFGGAWWIIRCLDHKPAATEPFDTVQLDCRMQAMRLKGARINGPKVATDFNTFRKAAPIQILVSRYKAALAQK